MFARLYLLALPILFLIDMTWVGVVAKDFYAGQIGFLMRSDIGWTAAILFYVLFIAGLVFFVIMPAIEKRSFLRALMSGAFFGLIAYATYDLTNLATVQNWPLPITIVDMLWGATLSAGVSVVVYTIATRLAPRVFLGK